MVRAWLLSMVISAGATAPATSSPPIDELLTTAAEACDALEFEVCIDRSNAALARADIQEHQRERAYVIVAGAYAVVGKVIEAERFYRMLLRLRPDFDLPPETPPKILGVFRRVRAEEDQIRNAVKDARRKSLMQSIRIDVDAPAQHTGGRPLVVTARVLDPQAGVSALTLEHRRDARAPFASVPFDGGGESRSVVFGAEQTASDAPVTLQYRVVARDAEGFPLFTREDGVINIAPGQVPSEPLFKQRSFWAVAGGGGVVAAVLGLGFVTSVLAAGVMGSAGLYLLFRADGVQTTTLGKHRVR